MQRLENAYQQICLDLACPAQVLTPTVPIRVLISPELTPQQSWVVFDGRITLRLPSPRTTGLLETNTPIDSGDPLTQLLYVRLSEIVARTLSGGDTRWSANSNGMLYLSSVARWELQRHFPQMDLNTYIGAALLRDRKITLPKYLWDWPVRDSRRLASPQAQTNSVVAFIDRSYGVQGVIKFLQTLNTAQSLPQAIEASLPISYASFEQQWQHWLDTRLRE
jgi:hypothetical protein